MNTCTQTRLSLDDLEKVAFETQVSRLSGWPERYGDKVEVNMTSHTGQVIRLVRKAQNLTLRQLADLSEVDYTTLSRIENGRIDPPARTIKAISEAVGKSMAGVA